MNNPFELIDARLSNIETLLLDIKHQHKDSKTEAASGELLTIRQTAELISLSVPTIYGLVSRSQIPCMKKGKRLYFSQKELTDWIKTGRKKTSAEIQNEATNFISRKALYHE